MCTASVNEQVVPEAQNLCAGCHDTIYAVNSFPRSDSTHAFRLRQDRLYGGLFFLGFGKSSLPPSCTGVAQGTIGIFHRVPEGEASVREGGYVEIC